MQSVDFDKIIQDHRNMMTLSKNLSDFQLNNLKSWPMVVFDHVDKCEISYNFFNEKEELQPGEITFNFFFKEQPSKEVADKAFENVSSWCKTIFFKETKISFQNEGESFRSEDHKEE